ncbi:AbrB/MazE/SpoVT family DNA-binding domain-containing protein [Photorhabdus sp. APURE]|uniref:antitoxin n=1 Tax=Photorhabdus aballayi TaxID=2991723 RepID=UPI00223DCE01|nr:AbrB/MazE/SpoVT family DNA-binding domain-containing protein [Photorhabdus aballayi]MCW7546909.1 AbrB/MazE/SpoVT family DNA-binding domain-containing protein [Photorhabdus aballayi]
MGYKAKLFMDGKSQAVRLPAAYRFDSDEVFIRKDPETGDVILSCKPHDWAGFFAALKGTTIPDDFLSKEERYQQEQSCGPFERWKD